MIELIRSAPRGGLGWSTGPLADVVAGVDGAAAFIADVRDAGAMSAAVAEAESRWGGLDAAVACAGVIAGGVSQWQLAAEQEPLADIGQVHHIPRL